MASTYPTVATCDAKIAELEAKRDALASVPTRGSVGSTSVDLSGKRSELEDELELWRERRLAALNGGRALPRMRTC